MDSTHFQTLFRFHFARTLQLLDLAGQLDDAAVREDTGYSRGSIYNLFVHTLSADRGWRIGLETGHQPAVLQPEDYPDLPALRVAFEQEREQFAAYLRGLSVDQIDGNADMITRRGMAVSMPRWRVLEHVLLHGMQHHADLAHLLTIRGKSPGDIDFIFFEG